VVKDIQQNPQIWGSKWKRSSVNFCSTNPFPKWLRKQVLTLKLSFKGNPEGQNAKERNPRQRDPLRIEARRKCLRKI
jgi:hypothetical protein